MIGLKMGYIGFLGLIRNSKFWEWRRQKAKINILIQRSLQKNGKDVL